MRQLGIGRLREPPLRPINLLIGLALFSCFSSRASAQPEGIEPTPEFAIVGKVDSAKGTVELKFAFHVVRMVTEERVKTEGGKEVPYKVMKSVLQLRVETETLPLDEIAVVDVKGKKVDKDAVLKRVKTGQAVLVSSTDQPLAPAVAKAVAADTLVFVSPPEEAEGPAPAPPAGPAPR